MLELHNYSDYLRAIRDAHEISPQDSQISLKHVINYINFVLYELIEQLNPDRYFYCHYYAQMEKSKQDDAIDNEHDEVTSELMDEPEVIVKWSDFLKYLLPSYISYIRYGTMILNMLIDRMNM